MTLIAESHSTEAYLLSNKVSESLISLFFMTVLCLHPQ